MDSTQQPQNREIVYCHRCENEWFRSEHGIICPECNSDFTEIIEENRDPRNDNGPHPTHGFYAPDPDEGDISDFQWTPHRSGGPAGGQFNGTFASNINTTAGGQEGSLAGSIQGLIGSALQGLLGGQQARQQTPQQGTAGPQEGFNRSVPGSPDQGQQQYHGGNGGAFVRHVHGPGYSYTITTSSSANLFPRNAGSPQPFNAQPDHIEQMMAQMIANIGGMQGRGFSGGLHAHGHGHGHDGPMFMGIGGPAFGGGMHGGGPPFHLLQLLGMARGGAHGDTVYSQEALDRIITQLMEQHQSGNAPGPASTEAIESLPNRQITQKDLGDSGKADCSICMDEAEIGSSVTELPCGHWFHHDCIKAWLTEHDTCPHCRQGIMPKDEPNTNRPRQPSQAPLHDMHSPDYQRQRVPGEYPFPRQGSSGGDGSQNNPFTVPESPDQSRQNGGSAGGMFSRMREAFSPGARNPRSNNADPGSGGSGSYDRSR